MTDQPQPVRRPVYAHPLPVAITDLGKVRPALETLWGGDLYLTQQADALVFWTAGRTCDCTYCARVLSQVIEETRTQPPTLATWALPNGCSLCGRTSCPRAKYHGDPCQRDDILTRITAPLYPEPLPAEEKP